MERSTAMVYTIDMFIWGSLREIVFILHHINGHDILFRDFIFKYTFSSNLSRQPMLKNMSTIGYYIELYV